MKPENVTCPECGGPMVSRQNRRDQTRFWGCKAYPKCTGTRNVDGEEKKPRCMVQFTNEEGETETLLPSDRQRDNDRRRW